MTGCITRKGKSGSDDGVPIVPDGAFPMEKPGTQFPHAFSGCPEFRGVAGPPAFDAFFGKAQTASRRQREPRCRMGKGDFMKAVLPMALLAMTFAASSVSAQCPPAEQAALEKFDRDWGAAGEAGDAAALDRILADDFRDLSPDGGDDKAASIAATLKEAEARRAEPDAPKMVPDNYIIHCSPTSATITHRATIEFKNAQGKLVPFYRRSMHTLEKRNGQWQVVATLAAPMNDADVLRYLERDWAAADVARDASWIEKNYAEDFVGISSRTGKFSSKADDLADLKTNKNVTTSARVSDVNVRREGDVAVVTGHYHASGKDEKGADFARHIAFTDVWKKTDGRWQVWSSQGTQVAE